MTKQLTRIPPFFEQFGSFSSSVTHAPASTAKRDALTAKTVNDYLSSNNELESVRELETKLTDFEESSSALVKSAAYSKLTSALDKHPFTDTALTLLMSFLLRKRDLEDAKLFVTQMVPILGGETGYTYDPGSWNPDGAYGLFQHRITNWQDNIKFAKSNGVADFVQNIPNIREIAARWGLSVASILNPIQYWGKKANTSHPVQAQLVPFLSQAQSLISNLEQRWTWTQKEGWQPTERYRNLTGKRWETIKRKLASLTPA